MERYEEAKLKKAGLHRVKKYKRKAPKYKKKTQDVGTYIRRNRRKKKSKPKGTVQTRLAKPRGKPAQKSIQKKK